MTNLAVNLFEMVSCVSRALDLLNPAVEEHHLRVSVIASGLARQLGFSEAVRLDLATAGALHDAAALLQDHRLAMHDFLFAGSQEEPRPSNADGVHTHAFEGARLLGRFSPFSNAASIVRHHHVPWDGGRGESFEGQPVSPLSHLLNLADRVAVLPTRANVLNQRQAIRERIRAASGTAFNPEHVSAFEELCTRESFWLDLVFDAPGAFFEETRTAAPTVLGLRQVAELAEVLGQLIDSRSPFTATHSAGVSMVAAGLASRLGMSPVECEMMRIAGLLHDLGKLAVPTDLLDKPGRLTPEEFSIVQTHTYHTFQVLKPVRCLQTINEWASLHHERLDRRGYPFHTAELSLGSRIMAVADIFTALSEDRPYRPGMRREAVTSLLQENVAGRAIDGDVVQALDGDRERFELIRRGGDTRLRLAPSDEDGTAPVERLRGEA